MSPLNSLRRFLALPRSERRRLLRAARRLLAIDLALRTRGFARVAAGLDRRPAGESQNGEKAVEPWVRAIDVAARHHLYPMRCLTRALALRSCLRDEGVEAELRFGVRKEGPELAAHAWLELGGMPLGDPGEDGRFAALAPAPPS